MFRRKYVVSNPRVKNQNIYARGLKSKQSI